MKGLTLSKLLMIVALVIGLPLMTIVGVQGCSISYRGLQKYGVWMEPQEVLKLEAMERVGGR